MQILSGAPQACYSLGEVSKKLRELVEGSLQSLWIASAFIDRCGVELLKNAYRKGVQVRVLTSAEVDEDVLKELAKIAEVRVIRERFMHMKLYIADGKALTGSANLTCPVLEGKNIEILCEIPLEEAVKNFTTLWTSAGGLELPEEIWLRVKDTQQRVIIESKIMQGLHIEIDKMLKRPVIKRDKGVEVCPDIVEVVCIECAHYKSFTYETLVSEAVEYLRSNPINLCYWKNYIMLPGDLKELLGDKISPIAFITVGLHPIASGLCSVELGKELATSLIEGLRRLGADVVDKCKAYFEPVISICLRFLDKPKVALVYRLDMYFAEPSCFREDIKMLIKSSVEPVLSQVLNSVKPLFEGKVKKLYEEYQKKLQSYGSRRVEIDGLLTAKLYIDAKGVGGRYEVELGAP